MHAHHPLVAARQLEPFAGPIAEAAAIDMAGGLVMVLCLPSLGVVVSCVRRPRRPS
jgi:hypothetical protein